MPSRLRKSVTRCTSRSPRVWRSTTREPRGEVQAGFHLFRSVARLNHLSGPLQNEGGPVTLLGPPDRFRQGARAGEVDPILLQLLTIDLGKNLPIELKRRPLPMSRAFQYSRQRGSQTQPHQRSRGRDQGGRAQHQLPQRDLAQGGRTQGAGRQARNPADGCSQGREPVLQSKFASPPQPRAR